MKFMLFINRLHSPLNNKTLFVSHTLRDVHSHTCTTHWRPAHQHLTALVIKAAMSCMADCSRCGDPSAECQPLENHLQATVLHWHKQSGKGRAEKEGMSERATQIERERARGPCVLGSLLWLIWTITDNKGEVGRELVTILFSVICSDKS